MLGGITGQKKRVTTRTLPRKKAVRRAITEGQMPEQAADMQAAQVRTGLTAYL